MLSPLISMSAFSPLRLSFPDPSVVSPLPSQGLAVVVAHGLDIPVPELMVIFGDAIWIKVC